MVEQSYLLLPDHQRIIELRSRKNWSIGQLAARAGVSVHTVERAERGERVQYKKLLGIAKALKVGVESIAVNLREDGTEPMRPSRIEVLDTWDETWSAMELATESILIIDSFFSEFGHLRTLLGKNAKSRTKVLNVSVYMTSPEKDFGAQRMKEKNHQIDEKTQSLPLVSWELTDTDRDDYEWTFRTFAEGINPRKPPRNVCLVVY